MNEERNFENEDQENRVYRERLLYAGELTKRIASVLNACETFAPAFEPLANLRAFLLPVIKTDVAEQTLSLRRAYTKFLSRLPQPIMNIPVQARRPADYGAPGYQSPSSQMFASRSSRPVLFWDDFPAVVRETVQNYFVPGQCVNTRDVQQIAHYAFARAEIEHIIKSADAHGLLLITGSSVAQGGMSLHDLED